MTVALKKKRLNTNCKLERNVYNCQGVKYLNIIFCGGGSLLISHEKYIKGDKVFVHLGFKSKVLSGPLNDLSAWVGFCTSSPQQGVKYQP